MKVVAIFVSTSEKDERKKFLPDQEIELNGELVTEGKVDFTKLVRKIGERREVLKQKFSKNDIECLAVTNHEGKPLFYDAHLAV